MKWIVFMVLVMPIVGVVILIAMVAPPTYGWYCLGDGPLRVVSAEVNEFDEEQIGNAEGIYGGGYSHDHYLVTIGIMVGFHETQLLDRGPTLEDGTFNVLSLYMPYSESNRWYIKTHAGKFFDEVVSEDDWHTQSPNEIARRVTGVPATNFDQYWDKAARILALVVETDPVELGVVGADDDLCNDAERVLWSTGGVILTPQGIVQPIPGELYVSSRFGWRQDPFTSEARLHGGTDYAASCGTPILAVDDAYVLQSKKTNDGYGNVIILLHRNGVQTRYAHMPDDGRFVERGDSVYKGQMIAEIGSTGRSTGCHLHFETWLPNGQVTDSRNVYGF